MPRNVEIKARVKNPDRLFELSCELTQSSGQVIEQRDTFFVVPEGRLKRRDFGNGRGELIRYLRPDAKGPKTSDYGIFPTDDPQGLGEVLAGALHLLGVVQKKRTLFLAGRTRIHLDEVQDLGCFMELEVVLKDGDNLIEGESEARRLMEHLGINPADLVEGSYLDLLLNPSRKEANLEQDPAHE